MLVNEAYFYCIFEFSTLSTTILFKVLFTSIYQDRLSLNKRNLHVHRSRPKLFSSDNQDIILDISTISNNIIFNIGILHLTLMA